MTSVPSLSHKVDHFFWRYLRQSQWLASASSSVDTDPAARCREKLAADLAVVRVMLAQDSVAVATMVKRYKYIDEIGLIGAERGLVTCPGSIPILLLKMRARH